MKVPKSMQQDIKIRKEPNFQFYCLLLGIFISDFNRLVLLWASRNN